MPRRFLALFVGLALLTGVYGCAGKPGGQAGGPGKAAGTGAGVTQVKMWIMPNSMSPGVDLEKVLEPFAKAHPDIQVVVVPIDWGAAWTKITTTAISGDAPDIVQLGTTWVGAISSMGALVDLADRLADLGAPASFLDASWKTSGIEGSKQVTALPWFVDARAMYYRTDVFKRLGLTEKDVADWDSFVKTLKKIQAAKLVIDGKPMAALGMPGKNDWNVIHNLAPWLWGAGGDFLKDGNISSDLGSPETVAGLYFYIDLVRQGFVPVEALELNSAQVGSNFDNGDYAITFDGPYKVRLLTTPAQQGGSAGSPAARHFMVAAYPQGPKGQVTFLGGSNLAVFKAAKHKDAAWQVIKYLMSKEAQVAYAKATGFLPATKEAFNDPFFADNPYWAVYREAVKYGKAYPCIAAWGKLEPVMTRRFGLMWDEVVGDPAAFTKEKLVKQLKIADDEVNGVLKGII